MKITNSRIRIPKLWFGLAVLVAALGLQVAPASASVSYYLPYAKDHTASLNQGPGGSTSHNTGSAYEHAYDFGLGGGEVWASAPGEIKSKVTNITGQTTTLNWGNYVVLEHADGTCTRYAHLAANSVTTLGVGTTVGQGAYLGREGNTGYTLPTGGGHHLHFQRETCNGNSLAVDFIENDWTSQNQRPSNPVAPPDARISVRADFNGDGYEDLLASSKRADTAPNLITYLSTGSWLGGGNLWSAPGSISWANAKLTAGDVDADGKSDLLAIQPQSDGAPNIYWIQSQGSSFAAPQLVGIPGLWFNDVKTWTSGDFNGDGADDLLAVSKRGDTAPNMVVFPSTGSWLGGGNVWSAPAELSWANMITVPADVDGDGKTDVIAIQPDSSNASNIYWLRSNGTSFDAPVLVGVSGLVFSNVNNWASGDFNGDGYDDLFASSQRNCPS